MWFTADKNANIWTLQRRASVLQQRSWLDYVCMSLMREEEKREKKDGSVNKLLCQPFALIYCCHLVENVKWVLPGRLNRILQE